jgi:hypothetical protein
VNAAIVRYLATSSFISRPQEIMVTGKLMQTLNLLIVSTAEKPFMIKPIALFQAEVRLIEMAKTI